MDAAMLLRRHRAGDDVADAGDLGGGDRHDRRRDMRVAPTRHVAAGGLHGNQPLTREEAGGKLGLETRHGVALAMGEVAHPLVGEGANRSETASAEAKEVAYGRLRGGRRYYK